MLQKKGKYWYVVINYKDGEKWKKKWIATGSESKREAKRQEKEIEYKAASGMTIYRAEKDIPTLRQFLEKWLSITIKPPARKPGTYENYKKVSGVRISLGSPGNPR